MPKKGGTATTTNTNTLDPATQRYIETYRNRALLNQQGAANGAVNSDLAAYRNQVSQMMGGLSFAGQTGLGGLDAYSDPYQQEVIGGVQADFDRQRALGDRSVADYATKAGAFGGDREAILRAEQARNINQAETGTLAQLRSAGFDQSVNRLFADRQMAGQLGLAGLGGLFNLGQWRDQNAAGALSGLIPGMTPGSQTQTQTQYQPGNPLAGLLGGALTLGGLGVNPLGALGTLGRGIGTLAGGLFTNRGMVGRGL